MGVIPFCKESSRLEDPLIHKKVLRTVYSSFFCSAQIQFEHFFRLPSCLVKCSRENELEQNFPLLGRNCPQLRRNSKSLQSCALQSLCLHVFAFTIVGALICHEILSNYLCINGSCKLSGILGMSLMSRKPPGVSMTPRKRGHDPLIFGIDPLIFGNDPMFFRVMETPGSRKDQPGVSFQLIRRALLPASLGQASARSWRQRQGVNAARNGRDGFWNFGAGGDPG